MNNKARTAIAVLILSISVQIPAAAATERVYIGSYTAPADGAGPAPPVNHGEGIYMATFDSGTGTLSVPKLAARLSSPTWIVVNAKRDVLYAIDRFRGDVDKARASLPSMCHEGVAAVSAYVIDHASGALTFVNQVDAGGDSCHLAIDPKGKYLLSANYGDGSIAVLPIREDGGLEPHTDLIHPTGPLHPDKPGDNPVQNYAYSSHTNSHVHMVGFDPSGRYVVANDAGLDKVLVFKSELDRGKLVPVATFDETPGSAPRHYAFSHDGRSFYNLLEQNSKLAVNSFNAETGAIIPRRKLSALPAGFAGSSKASEILAARNGRFLYAGNRVNDTIATFAIDARGGARLLANTHTGADNPRSLAFDTTQQYLFSINQGGDSITVFKLDPKTGLPMTPPQWVPVPSPTVMVFIE
ncbi:MAG TPA: lactonase family protein [Sphingomonas sp.]|nr:lactonase family protein [Sphingomonas sp.]